jgi:hypothetical protein
MTYLTVASGAGPHDFSVCAERKRVSGYYEQQIATIRASLARAEAELARAKPVVDAAVRAMKASDSANDDCALGSQIERNRRWNNAKAALDRAILAYLASEPKETK